MNCSFGLIKDHRQNKKAAYKLTDIDNEENLSISFQINNLKTN